MTVHPHPTFLSDYPVRHHMQKAFLCLILIIIINYSTVSASQISRSAFFRNRGDSLPPPVVSPLVWQ